MQEQTSIVPPEKIAQQLFRLPSTPFDVHSPQNGNNILEQKLSIVCPPLL
jgi:hypothetical protein